MLYDNYNLPDLVKYAKQEGLKTTGKKTILIKRIVTYVQTGVKEEPGVKGKPKTTVRIFPKFSKTKKNLRKKQQQPRQQQRKEKEEEDLLLRNKKLKKRKTLKKQMIPKLNKFL